MPEIIRHMSVHRATAYRWKSKLARDGHLEEKKRSGRPCLATPRSLRHLCRVSKKYKRRSAKFIASAAGFDVDRKTARKYLKLAGVSSVKQQKRQYLTKRHAKLRQKWAREHVGMSEEQWKRWVFSDECSVEMMCGEAGQGLWIRAEDKLRPENVGMVKQKGGGSVMVWGAISAYGCGPLVFIDGRLDHAKYLEILQTVATPYLDGLCEKHGGKFTYQDDNARPHRAKRVCEFKSSCSWEGIVWPALSPDLNPIEHIWAFVKKKLTDMRPEPASKEELKRRIAHVWNGIPADLCHNLVVGMRDRVQKLKASRGWYF